MSIVSLRDSTVLYLSRLRGKSRDWTNQDIAEFYRIEAALSQANFQVEFDRGLSDEGDPWCVFCRADTGDVVVHFARIDGTCIVSAPILELSLTGVSFQDIVQQFLIRLPAVTPKRRFGKESQLFLHPATMLIAMVATAFCASGLANGNDDEHTPQTQEGATLNRVTDVFRSYFGSIDAASLSSRDKLAKLGILTAIVVAIEYAAVHDTNVIATVLHQEAISAVSTDPNIFSHSSVDLLAELSAPPGADADKARSQEAVDFRIWSPVAAEVELVEEFQATVSTSAKNASDVASVMAPAFFEQSSSHFAYSTDGSAGFDFKIDVIVNSSLTNGNNKHEGQAPASNDYIHDLRMMLASVVLLDIGGATGAAELVLPPLAETKSQDNAQLATPSAQGQPASSSTPNAVIGAHAALYDADAQAVVSAFIHSDTDIQFVNNGGNIVIFDRSDFMDSSIALDIETWSFGSESLISIVGSSAKIDMLLAHHL